MLALRERGMREYEARRYADIIMNDDGSLKRLFRQRAQRHFPIEVKKDGS